MEHLPEEIWFALGVAYAQHRLYMFDDTVITNVDVTPGQDERCKPLAYRVKLRTSNMRDFDAEHWRAMLERYLAPLGFTVQHELQHMVIEFVPPKDGKLYGRSE